MTSYPLGHILGQTKQPPFTPTLGIITALPKEYVAMEVLLEQAQEIIVPGEGASRRYTIGKIPQTHGGERSIVLALLPTMGTSAAATSAARLLEHFPQIKEIIMVGIAGGVPYPEKPDEHVRLGDIVVSNQYGVIQYDFVKRTHTNTIYRPLPQPPSASLLLAVRYLEAGLLKGQRPWNTFIAQAKQRLHVKRPTKLTDVLLSTIDPEKIIPHPKDKKRKANEPRVFIGPIASANTLLKDASLRDELRERFGSKAIEMEAAGVSGATWDVGAGYLVVRGICDYCDEHKNDLWQEYAAVVAAAYTRALIASIPVISEPKEEHVTGDIRESKGLSPHNPATHDERPRTIDAFPSIWNVPYRFHPLFADRKDILQKIHDGFATTSTQAVVTPRALTGPSGIGKTRVATEYAFHYRTEYDAILWVDAASHEILSTQFIALAHELNLTEKAVQDQNLVRTAVTHWLSEHTHWLLIFDNANDLKMVEEFLPTTGRGHVLLTSQARAMSQLASRIVLEPMTPDEGAHFLLRRATVLELDEPLEQADRDDLKNAQEITRLMGGLPLALDQAGAYIEETMCGVSGYIEVYLTHAKELLNERGEIITDHPKSIATTWLLAFERIDKHKAAAELLRLCAFLYPDAIPEEILLNSMGVADGAAMPIVADRYELDLAARELIKSSLIQRDNKTKTLTIHRLVQDTLKKYWMSQQTLPLWAEQAVRAVHRTFPVELSGSWLDYQRYLPQVFTCTESIDTYQLNFVEAAQLLERVAHYLTNRAQYDQAEPLYHKAITMYQNLPATQLATVKCAEQYTSLLRKLQRVSEAAQYEQLAKRLRSSLA